MDKPVYCLDAKDHNKPGIRKYLDEGERLGYHNRYLTKTRRTRIKLKIEKPAPILFGVFNRDAKIRNTPQR